jgi:predicted transcriptional regulator
MKKASTFRLHEDVQAGLDLISQLQHRPKNKLVNEAVAEYVTRHSVQTEAALHRTLDRLKAYQRIDPDSEQAIDAFIDAEAAHGKHEDPMEGEIAPPNGPISDTLRQLIDA